MSRRTPEELREKIYSGNWGVREFAVLQEQLGDELLFTSLYSLFCGAEAPSRLHDAQNLAGIILQQLNPPCPVSVEEFLRSTLLNWEKSVEQLPSYLGQQFGRDAVLRAIDDLDGEASSTEEFCDKLATYRYWLKA